jgi:hypothetical protein
MQLKATQFDATPVGVGSLSGLVPFFLRQQERDLGN